MQFVVYAQKKYTVTGQVTQTSDYCGGAAPDPNEYEKMKTPKAYPNYIFYITKKSKSGKKSVIKKITTDASGNFKTTLPKGKYCIVTGDKLGKFIAPKDDKMNQYDIPCLRNTFNTCNYELIVTNSQKNKINFNIQKHCPWSTPCVNYKGPLPPASRPNSPEPPMHK